ncbi:pyridoxamine 5'-phosphate oxidase family protein [Candidatus Bathyarchaeota archaeon]|nr:pyridoxamine 5'-phosphate oxidase family protein [Candidatus Bathyarchaeota archaeon]
MVKVPVEIREVFNRQRTIPLGTSSAFGVPNTAYIGSWWWEDDETILVMDNFFRKTRENLDENPVASLLAWSREQRKSYQMKCSATVLTEGPEYDKAFRRERMRKDFHYPCKAVVLLRVEEVYRSWYGEGAGDQVL